jgi:hypothetical protein
LKTEKLQENLCLEGLFTLTQEIGLFKWKWTSGNVEKAHLTANPYFTTKLSKSAKMEGMLTVFGRLIHLFRLPSNRGQ